MHCKEISTHFHDKCLIVIFGPIYMTRNFGVHAKWSKRSFLSVFHSGGFYKEKDSLRAMYVLRKKRERQSYTSSLLPVSSILWFFWDGIWRGKSKPRKCIKKRKLVSWYSIPTTHSVINLNYAPYHPPSHFTSAYGSYDGKKAMYIIPFFITNFVVSALRLFRTVTELISRRSTLYSAIKHSKGWETACLAFPWFRILATFESKTGSSMLFL